MIYSSLLKKSFPVRSVEWSLSTRISCGIPSFVKTSKTSRTVSPTEPSSLYGGINTESFKLKPPEKNITIPSYDRVFGKINTNILFNDIKMADCLIRSTALCLMQKFKNH